MPVKETAAFFLFPCPLSRLCGLASFQERLPAVGVQDASRPVEQVVATTHFVFLGEK